MKYSQATQGRVFVIRLEDGDIVHREIEALARKEAVTAAALTIVGGVDTGSTLIVGPEDGRTDTITPMEHVLDNVREIVGTGTLFPNADGEPVLHMHMACGRQTDTITGCIRRGVKTWHVLEVIMVELIGTPARRILDAATGFELLNP
ncbi:DNA-binding protein [Desulfatiferula olefinivorans]